MDDLGKDEAKRRSCEDKASYKSSCFALRYNVFVRSFGRSPFRFVPSKTK